MAAARVRGRWVEAGLVGLAGFLHGVVDFQDRILGAIVAVSLNILPFDDGKSLYDVVHGIARGEEAGLEPCQVFRRLALRRAPVAVLLGRQVEVEEGGVQLAPEQEAALLVPAERRAGSAAVLGERLQVPRRKG